jgi:putative aminopeptidase FrvX
MDKKSKEFLYKYLNNASPTGFESSGQQIWLDYIKPYINEHIVDVYGTVVGVVNPKAAYKVVIEARADEISWFVNYITDDGYIYVRRNGGSDHQIAPSKRVNIHTDKGVVKGIFGWPAIHVRDAAREEAPTLKNIFIDIGAASKKEVEGMGVHVGCVITFEDELIEMNKD